MNKEDLYEAGLIAIQKNSNELKNSQISISAIQICDLISVAIQYGAPVYNQGFPEKCAKIYCKAAKELTDLLQIEPNDLLGKFRFLCEKISDVISKYDDVNDKNADDVAWDLRDIFDKILVEHFSTWAISAINAVDKAFDSEVESSTLISLSKIQWILALTISKGSPVYDEGYHKDCAMVYLHSARLLDNLLIGYSREDIESNYYLSFSQQTIGCCLSDFSSVIEDPDRKYVWALKNRPKELSWKLRKSFDSILALEYTPPPSLAASNNKILSSNHSEIDDIENIVRLAYEDMSFGDIQELLEIISGLHEFADEGIRGWRLLLQSSNLAEFSSSLDYLSESPNEVAKRLVIDLLMAKQLGKLIQFIKDLRSLPPSQKAFLEKNIEKYLTSSSDA